MNFISTFVELQNDTEPPRLFKFAYISLGYQKALGGRLDYRIKISFIFDLNGAAGTRRWDSWEQKGNFIRAKVFRKVSVKFLVSRSFIIMLEQISSMRCEASFADDQLESGKCKALEVNKK